MVAARWLLGDRPETVQYNMELGHNGNSDVFRLLRNNIVILYTFK